jgi:hypothetical protein
LIRAQKFTALEKLPKHFEPSDALTRGGVYFFYEKGPAIAHNVENRIVRVGKPGANRSLKERLKTIFAETEKGAYFESI